MMLHDVSPERLGVARRFAERVNERNGSPITIEASLDPSEALSGADFCLTSAEVGRWQHWIEDYEIPVRHGATQITGENGGPGAVFHSLRSIRTMLGICAEIERYCPDAFLINLTNPLSRVALAVNSGTAIKNISMCHEFAGGVGRIARLLRIPKAKIVAKASGINHFTFFTEIKRADTGEDLLSAAAATVAEAVLRLPATRYGHGSAAREGPVGADGGRADVLAARGPHVP